MARSFAFVFAVASLLVTAASFGLAADSNNGWNPPPFERAQGRRTWLFPRDHGQHPGFRLEWWYYTGILHTSAGRTFGFQVTFFRQGVAPVAPAGASAWRVQSLYLAYIAVSDVQSRSLLQSTRVGRDSVGLSGAAIDRLNVWIGNWRAESVEGDHHGTRLAAGTDEFSLDLVLQAEKPPVLHGDSGLDQKGAAAGQASWYYSIPRLRAEGTLGVGRETLQVTGAAWMDHEFGTNQLGDNQVGWDWFSIRFSDGYDLMLYRLRLKDGAMDPASHGTLIDPQGRGMRVQLTPAVTMAPLRHWSSPESHGRYPVAWHIRLPKEDLVLEIEPMFDNQEMQAGRGLPFAYWEGAISIRGTRGGVPVTGEGYLELTGYAGGLRQSFR